MVDTMSGAMTDERAETMPNAARPRVAVWAMVNAGIRNTSHRMRRLERKQARANTTGPAIVGGVCASPMRIQKAGVANPHRSRSACVQPGLRVWRWFFRRCILRVKACQVAAKRRIHAAIRGAKCVFRMGIGLKRGNWAEKPAAGHRGDAVQERLHGCVSIGSAPSHGPSW